MKKIRQRITALFLTVLIAVSSIGIVTVSAAETTTSTSGAVLSNADLEHFVNELKVYTKGKKYLQSLNKYSSYIIDSVVRFPDDYSIRKATSSKSSSSQSTPSNNDIQENKPDSRPVILDPITVNIFCNDTNHVVSADTPVIAKASDPDYEAKYSAWNEVSSYLWFNGYFDNGSYDTIIVRPYLYGTNVSTSKCPLTDTALYDFTPHAEAYFIAKRHLTGLKYDSKLIESVLIFPSGYEIVKNSDGSTLSEVSYSSQFSLDLRHKAYLSAKDCLNVFEFNNMIINNVLTYH